MRAGEIARRTGASAKAIRLYEARDLLGTVAPQPCCRTAI